MHFLPVLTGISLFALVLGLGLLHRRLLPRTICPECGGQTNRISLGSAGKLLERWVVRRWCAACDWQGVGRNGPMHVPGRRPVSHDSGFCWGDDRLPADFGFQWRATDDASPPESPAHPSGFRWGATDELPTSGRPGRPASDHPSGFSWGGTDRGRP